MSRPSGNEPTDRRAVVSLLLGLLSLVSCGLTAIPAIAAGLSARAAIERSGGRLQGSGIAAAGIATGVGGAVLSVVAAAAFVAGVTFASHGGVASYPMVVNSPLGTTTLWSPQDPSPHDAAQGQVGSIRLATVDPDSKQTFHEQLEAELKRAAAAHQIVVLMTSARRCSVCREIEESLSDSQMQTALANVVLVRVDINDFAQELDDRGMLEKSLPWFYKLDASLKPTDAISAGEWDENIPENMAPVLRSFFAGKLHARRSSPEALGVSL